MRATTARLVYYSGNVQGVGFRATTVHLARSHPVTGWVRNLPDGRVQLMVEGSADAVDRFLAAVRAYWNHYIEDERREEQVATGKHARFDIIH
jgi:acylphosphatase